MFNQRVREERAPATSSLSPLKARAFEAFGKPDGTLGIWLAGHRDFVGGRWLEVSRLQTDFMIKMGLKPENVLLDVGCGIAARRRRVYFVSARAELSRARQLQSPNTGGNKRRARAGAF